jgi:hypothetical protein
MAVHVWKKATPKYPYATKETGLTTVQAGVDELAHQGVKVLYVHGDCDVGRCEYVENVRIPVSGVDIIGVGLPVIESPGYNPSTGAVGTGRVITFLEDQPPLTTLSGFEIRGGGGVDHGAGLLAKDSAVTITGNCIHNNNAGKTGGGICIQYTAKDKQGRVSTISNNSIYKNNAKRGAGIRLEGVHDLFEGGFEAFGPLPPSVHVLSNVVGPDNHAGNVAFGYGGGISDYRLPVLIEGNEVKNNLIDRCGEGNGAGICVHNFDENDATLSYLAALGGLTAHPWTFYSVQVQLINNYVHDNHAQSAGGGVAALWAAILSFSSNLIQDNISDGNGGGAYATVGSELLFGDGNGIHQNHANGHSRDGYGGGVRLSCRSRASFEGKNLIDGNHAVRDGGGISVHNSEIQSSGVLGLISNQADGRGGGICTDDLKEVEFNYRPCDSTCDVELRDALIERNTAALGGGGAAVLSDDAGLVLLSKPVIIRG